MNVLRDYVYGWRLIPLIGLVPIAVVVAFLLSYFSLWHTYPPGQFNIPSTASTAAVLLIAILALGRPAVWRIALIGAVIFIGQTLAYGFSIELPWSILFFVEIALENLDCAYGVSGYVTRISLSNFCYLSVSFAIGFLCAFPKSIANWFMYPALFIFVPSIVLGSFLSFRIEQLLAPRYTNNPNPLPWHCIPILFIPWTSILITVVFLLRHESNSLLRRQSNRVPAENP